MRHILSLSKNHTQFAKFIAVGVLNTLFGYGIYFLLVQLKVHFALAVLCSTLLGIIFNFKTTGKLVFESHDNSLFKKFTLVYAILYLINISGIRIFSMMNISYELGGALMLIPMALLSFLLNKKFVFNYG